MANRPFCFAIAVLEIRNFDPKSIQEVQMHTSLFRLHQNGDAHEDFAAVRFNGSDLWLDDDTVSGIRDSMVAMVENASEARVIVDLGNVEYVCSSFLGLMVRLHKKQLAAGRGLEIRNLRPCVFEIFAVCSLNRFLNLFPADNDHAGLTLSDGAGAPTLASDQNGFPPTG
jgi:anti-anti-sigma factor